VTRQAAPDVTGNRLLAARARDLARRAPQGSVECKAAGCVAVLLDQTRSAAAARVLLGEIGPVDVRVRAAQLLAELAAPEGGP
jgi:hypothetical protein